MLNDGHFTEINESFTCFNCHKEVPKCESTCRNHCPFCLYSKHVDIMPGDRAATCGGPMPAIGYENHPKKGLVLVHRCEICHFIQKNKSAAKDKFQTDDLKVILNLHLQ